MSLSIGFNFWLEPCFSLPPQFFSLKIRESVFQLCHTAVSFLTTTVVKTFWATLEFISLLLQQWDQVAIVLRIIGYQFAAGTTHVLTVATKRATSAVFAIHIHCPPCSVGCVHAWLNFVWEIWLSKLVQFKVCLVVLKIHSLAHSSDHLVASKLIHGQCTSMKLVQSSPLGE